ncbi:hypothetical protein BO85DRAFT_106678 [Aspergillus piperis CBS 112811]|uniref:Uncharacterized protein n=1 Tax=Aspergillus piperis CBS 112811 TaxID=1448313 RepID=A0A8G1RAF0_9EURO|nr:hypothetical protein BO85DRAFT_106678 [Aspergillus piperis CBS 112811]RAH61516.1 hypothetical protein BO85DRAFT_106678 [Aspergillus piperis CBS 112811]
MALSPLIPKRGMAEDSPVPVHCTSTNPHCIAPFLILHPISESCVLVYWGQSIGEIVTPRSLDWTTPLVVCCWNPSQCFPRWPQHITAPLGLFRNLLLLYRFNSYEKCLN